MARPSKLEIPDFLPLLHLITSMHCIHAARSFTHSDIHNRYLPNRLINCLNSNDHACGDRTQERFTIEGSLWIESEKL